MNRILLIEDDDLFGKIYTDLLNQESGYSVEWIMDGDTGYKKIIEGGWNLILLDSLLPKMNAVDILNKIKITDPGKFNQKILIITNLESGKMMEDIKSFGFEVIIKSDLDPVHFVSKIKNLLR